MRNNTSTLYNVTMWVLVICIGVWHRWCHLPKQMYPANCEFKCSSRLQRQEYSLYLTICDLVVLTQGVCLDPHKDEPVELVCKRVRKNKLCKSWDQCQKVILPTDGCCPICGESKITITAQVKLPVILKEVHSILHWMKMGYRHTLQYMTHRI